MVWKPTTPYTLVANPRIARELATNPKSPQSWAIQLSQLIARPKYKGVVEHNLQQQAVGLQKLLYNEGLLTAPLSKRADFLRTSGYSLSGWNRSIREQLGPVTDSLSWVNKWTELALENKRNASLRTRMVEDEGIAQFEGWATRRPEFGGGLGKVAGRTWGTVGAAARRLTPASKRGWLGLGIGAGLLGLYALKPLSLFSAHDDNYNTIEGLRHGGSAEHKRHQLTDFGSGWQGLMNVAFRETAEAAAMYTIPRSNLGQYAGSSNNEDIWRNPRRPRFNQPYQPISGRDDSWNIIEGLRHGGFTGILRQHMTDFGSGYKGDRKHERDARERFDVFKKALSKYGVEEGTGHKRILIPKDLLSEQELTEGLGFVPVKIAIPEAGQVSSYSYRNPHNRYHLHDFGDSWSMHKDRHTASTMALLKAKEEGHSFLGGIGEFISGIPHIITEGIPGAYYYLRGQMSDVGSMAERLKEDLPREYGQLVNRLRISERRNIKSNRAKNPISSKDDDYNTIPGLSERGIAARQRKIITDFGSGYQGEKQRSSHVFQKITGLGVVVGGVYNFRDAFTPLTRAIKDSIVSDLTGRRIFYHGTSKIAAESIRKSGLLQQFSSREGGFTRAALSNKLSEKEMGKFTYLATSEMEGLTYAGQAHILSNSAFSEKVKKEIHSFKIAGLIEDEEKQGPGILLGRAQQQIQRELVEIGKPSLKKYKEGLLKFSIPEWRKDFLSNQTLNPEIAKYLDYSDWANKTGIEKDQGKKSAEETYRLLSNAKVYNRDIGAEFIVGSSTFKKVGMEEIKEYISHRPGNFAKGIGKIGLVGLATAGIGSWLFSGKDDNYNTIEGLSHKGIAQQGRKETTDFGSGYRGEERKDSRHILLGSTIAGLGAGVLATERLWGYGGSKFNSAMYPQLARIRKLGRNGLSIISAPIAKSIKAGSLPNRITFAGMDVRKTWKGRNNKNKLAYFLDPSASDFEDFASAPKNTLGHGNWELGNDKWITDQWLREQGMGDKLPETIAAFDLFGSGKEWEAAQIAARSDSPEKFLSSVARNRLFRNSHAQGIIKQWGGYGNVIVKKAKAALQEGVWMSPSKLPTEELRSLFEDPKSYLIQRKVPLAAEFRTITVGGKQVFAAHRFGGTLTQKVLDKLHPWFPKVVEGIKKNHYHENIVPIMDSETLKGLTGFTENLARKLPKGLEIAAYDIGMTAEKKFKLIEIQRTFGTIKNPIVSSRIAEMVTGKATRLTKMSRGVGIGLLALGAYALIKGFGAGESIDGMSEKGIAAQKRKEETDFGSSWISKLMGVFRSGAKAETSKLIPTVGESLASKLAPWRGEELKAFQSFNPSTFKEELSKFAGGKPRSYEWSLNASSGKMGKEEWGQYEKFHTELVESKYRVAPKESTGSEKIEDLLALLDNSLAKKGQGGEREIFHLPGAEKFQSPLIANLEKYFSNPLEKPMSNAEWLLHFPKGSATIISKEDIFLAKDLKSGDALLSDIGRKSTGQVATQEEHLRAWKVRYEDMKKGEAQRIEIEKLSKEAALSRPRTGTQANIGGEDFDAAAKIQKLQMAKATKDTQFESSYNAKYGGSKHKIGGV